MHNALHALCPFALRKCPSLKMTFIKMPFRKCPFRYVLHQNVLSVMPIQICPFKNALSKMPFQKCPFKNALSHFALSQFALSQFALYQIAVYQECNIIIMQYNMQYYNAICNCGFKHCNPTVHLRQVITMNQRRSTQILIIPTDLLELIYISAKRAATQDSFHQCNAPHKSKPCFTQNPQQHNIANAVVVDHVDLPRAASVLNPLANTLRIIKNQLS